jgi:hypothetical protein
MVHYRSERVASHFAAPHHPAEKFPEPSLDGPVDLGRPSQLPDPVPLEDTPEGNQQAQGRAKIEDNLHPIRDVPVNLSRNFFHKISI